MWLDPAGHEVLSAKEAVQDHALAPCVGSGVSDAPSDTKSSDGTNWSGLERKFWQVKRYGITPSQETFGVAEVGRSPVGLQDAGDDGLARPG